MDEGVLADAWVSWIAENALRGAPVADLVAGLVAGGVPADRAEREVLAVVRSPVLAGARGLVARSGAMEQVARLRKALDPEPVAIRTTLDDEALYREHWTAHRPVVLRGGAARWPAARWTLEELGRRHGAVEVDVIEREGDWWAVDRRSITRRMPLGELVATALGPPTDRWYADGRADLLDQPGLEGLRADLGVLPGISGTGEPRVWLGPAGTVTPTHHDQSTGWLAQLVGRKRVALASPLEPALASTAVGLYNRAEPGQTAGELAEVRWYEVEIGPGDAVLIPVGWWHRVVALEPSISVSLGRFRWPNAFEWYLPGRRS